MDGKDAAFKVPGDLDLLTKSVFQLSLQSNQLFIKHFGSTYTAWSFTAWLFAAVEFFWCGKPTVFLDEARFRLGLAHGKVERLDALVKIMLIV